jgi:hypothetical protein
MHQSSFQNGVRNSIAALFARIAAEAPPVKPKTDSRVQQWRDALPDHLSTTAIERCDPLALIHIAREWHAPKLLNMVFESCIYRKGPARIGAQLFDLEALEELAALQEYANRVVHRRRVSVWDSAY